MYLGVNKMFKRDDLRRDSIILSILKDEWETGVKERVRSAIRK